MLTLGFPERRYRLRQNATDDAVARTRLALQLWSDMNQLTTEYANQVLGYDNFLVVRIEDLVQPMKKDKVLQNQAWGLAVHSGDVSLSLRPPTLGDKANDACACACACARFAAL